jgi:hypothetical protein
MPRCGTGEARSTAAARRQALEAETATFELNTTKGGLYGSQYVERLWDETLEKCKRTNSKK